MCISLFSNELFLCIEMDFLKCNLSSALVSPIYILFVYIYCIYVPNLTFVFCMLI